MEVNDQNEDRDGNKTFTDLEYFSSSLKPRRLRRDQKLSGTSCTRWYKWKRRAQDSLGGANEGQNRVG